MNDSLIQDNHHDDKAKNRTYVALLSSNHQRIYNYILLLVPNHNDADDIMQETSIVMFEKFDDFQTGTDFFPWAAAVAKYQVLNFLKKKKRDNLVFDQEIVEMLSGEGKERVEKFDEWIEALRKCVSKLHPTDRQLLKFLYYEKTNVKAIADRFGSSFQAVYRSLSRVNGLLLRCVRRTMTGGGDHVVFSK
jgi:RNA polymerase sigma-70 factor, ECF subfamily